MPAPEVVIPLLEGHIGSIANGGESTALFVKMCKEIMLATSHKDQSDWEFKTIAGHRRDQRGHGDGPGDGCGPVRDVGRVLERHDHG